MPERHSIDDIYRLLFGWRQCSFVRFGQAENEPDLQAEIKARATGDLQGLDLELQVRASRGLFPMIAISWEAVCPRDMAANEVKDRLAQRQSRGVQAKFTYSVAFCGRETCARFYMELICRLKERTHTGLPSNMQEVVVSRGLSVIEQLWPMRRGDRMVQAYFAKAPIPGRNPEV